LCPAKQFGVLHPDAEGNQLTLAGLRSALGPAVFNKELTDVQTAALHTELCTTGAVALATAEAERNKRPPALHSPITASTITTATAAPGATTAAGTAATAATDASGCNSNSAAPAALSVEAFCAFMDADDPHLYDAVMDGRRKYVEGIRAMALAAPPKLLPAEAASVARHSALHSAAVPAAALDAAVRAARLRKRRSSSSSSSGDSSSVNDAATVKDIWSLQPGSELLTARQQSLADSIVEMSQARHLQRRLVKSSSAAAVSSFSAATSSSSARQQQQQLGQSHSAASLTASTTPEKDPLSCSFASVGGPFSDPVASHSTVSKTVCTAVGGSAGGSSGAELFRTLRSCEHAAAGRRALANTVHVGAATWADIGHGGGSSAAVAGVDSSSSFYASPAARFTTTQMERHGPLVKVTHTNTAYTHRCALTDTSVYSAWRSASDLCAQPCKRLE
jgi:hypothetical protein